MKMEWKREGKSFVDIQKSTGYAKFDQMIIYGLQTTKYEVKLQYYFSWIQTRGIYDTMTSFTPLCIY